MTGALLALLVLSTAQAEESWGQISDQASAARVGGALGWRRAAAANFELAPAKGLATEAWAGGRNTAPGWAPALGVAVRTGGTVGRLGLGGRLSTDWIGGTDMPGLDTRLYGVAELRIGGGTWIHTGSGPMAITTSGFPTVLCFSQRLGISGRVSERTSLAMDAEVPLVQLAGPPITSAPSAHLTLRTSLGARS